MNALEKWYRKTVGDDSDNAVSSKTGIPSATVWRQAPGKFSPENVVRIARAYGVNVIDGLIAQGLLDPTDVQDARALDALQSADDDQLLEELSRRLHERPEDGEWDKPLPDPTPLHPVGGQGEDDLHELELREAAERSELGDLHEEYDGDDGA